MNLFLLIVKGMNRDIPDPNPFIEIAEHLGAHEVTPLEIIERLNEVGFSQTTHVGNEHLNILFSRIESCLKERGIECSYFVNALDSHFYVQGDEIKKLQDIAHLLNDATRH
jgi:DNA-binding Lrp family transcriptional regulator